MALNEREPIIEAPMATSSDTFSFTDHSVYMSG